MERIAYPNQPVTEAICQFEFEYALAWSALTPILFYQKLVDRYPVEPDQQEQVQASFGPSTEGSSPEFSISRSANRFIYRDTSRTRLIVLSPTNISANSIKPYEGWLSLNDRLRSAINSLEEVGVVPPVSRASLRYINQIQLGVGAVELADYIKIPVQAAAFDGAVVGAFVNRTESLLPNDVRINVTFASIAPPAGDEESANVVLDIDCMKVFDSGVPIREALAVTDDLKELENSQFEALLTDECRRLFK